MIFKFRKETCTRWSAVKKKKIHYSSLTILCRFPLSSQLAASHPLFLFHKHTNTLLHIRFLTHFLHLLLFCCLYIPLILCSYCILTDRALVRKQRLLNMLPAYISGLRIDLNHKKWGSLINLCPCLCSVHHPTYSSPPIIPSPISPPAPSLYHSIRIACVWILMLITPRLKIAVQSVISPRYVLTKHTLHIHIRKGWYHKRWVFVELHNRSLNQGSGPCGIASFLPPNKSFLKCRSSIWQIIPAKMRHCINYIFDNSQQWSLNHCWWGWCYFTVGGEVTPCDSVGWSELLKSSGINIGLKKMRTTKGWAVVLDTKGTYS